MVVKKTLYSVNPAEYPDIEVDFQVYDTPQEILKNATVGATVYARKTAPVKIRYAKVGDVVDTRPRLSYEGKIYTFSEVQRKVEAEYKDPSDPTTRMVIVTNPDGEEYLQTEAKARSKYNLDGVTLSYENQTVTPKGNVVVAFRQISENVTVNVWGDPWFVTAGGFVTADEADCYPITDQAMQATYVPVNSNNKNKAD